MSDATETEQHGAKTKQPEDLSTWQSYNELAGAFDGAQVAMLRDDMNNLLLFAGLYSAAMTALLSGSLELLQPDNSSATVALLAQLTQQLSAMANGNSSAAAIPSAIPTPFRASVSGVTVNILWFFSLALSLCCALTATLVIQWATEIQQQVLIYTDPRERAEMREFISKGLYRRRFRFWVQAVPALLHISLAFFFCGLVVYLYSIHGTVAIAFSVVVFPALCNYVYISLEPLRDLSSPFHTPMTEPARLLSNFFVNSRNRLPTRHDFVFPDVKDSECNPQTQMHRQRMAAIHTWALTKLNDPEKRSQFMHNWNDETKFSPDKPDDRNLAANEFVTNMLFFSKTRNLQRLVNSIFRTRPLALKAAWIVAQNISRSIRRPPAPPSRAAKKITSAELQERTDAELQQITASANTDVYKRLFRCEVEKLGPADQMMWICSAILCRRAAQSIEKDHLPETKIAQSRSLLQQAQSLKQMFWKSESHEDSTWPGPVKFISKEDGEWTLVAWVLSLITSPQFPIKDGNLAKYVIATMLQATNRDVYPESQPLVNAPSDARADISSVLERLLSPAVFTWLKDSSYNPLTLLAQPQDEIADGDMPRIFTPQTYTPQIVARLAEIEGELQANEKALGGAAHDDDKKRKRDERDLALVSHALAAARDWQTNPPAVDDQLQYALVEIERVGPTTEKCASESAIDPAHMV